MEKPKDSMNLIGIKMRFLEAGEKSSAHTSQTGLTVLEANAKATPDELFAECKAHANVLLSALYESGALLFRGFPIEKASDFQKLILSICPANPMQGRFMSGKSPEKAAEEQYVSRVQASPKTKDAFQLGFFHSEDTGSPDMPSKISFWCKEPSEIGGETALVYSPGVYRKLPDLLKARLLNGPVLAAIIPLQKIALSYGMSEAAVEAFALEQGLIIKVTKGKKSIHLLKPNIVRHPANGRLSFQNVLALDCYLAEKQLRSLLISNFKGKMWFKKRLGWFYKGLASDAFHVCLMLKRRIRSKIEALPYSESLRDRFTSCDFTALAQGFRENLIAFNWQKGDVLLIDSLQMLHSPMPAIGSQEMYLMMCDPFPIDYANVKGVISPGLKHSGFESLHIKLDRYLAQRSVKKITRSGSAKAAGKSLP